MSKRKMSKAETLGHEFGLIVIKVAQLFYQENTKKNFFKGLLETLHEVKA